MKKFIITIVLFSISIIAGDFVIGGLSDALEKFTIEKRPEAFNIKIPYIINTVDDDVLIWGSSTASHNYITQEIEDSIGMSTYNCGYDGSFVYVQSALLDLLLARYTPKVIIWEIAPNCLSSTISDTLEFACIEWLYPFYDRNSMCKYIIDIQDDYNWLKLKSQSICRNSRFQEYLHCFLTRNCYYPTGYAPIFYEGIPYPKKESSIDANDIVKSKEKCLETILRKLADKNVKVVFSFCPIYRYRQVLEGKSFNRLLEIADKYNVKVMNYYELESIVGDSTFFKDNDHMYETGARRYMRTFIPRLKDYLNDKSQQKCNTNE